MAKCCIRGCNSNSRNNEEGLSFFRLPKNKELCNLWLESIGKKSIKPAGSIKICSKHFEENCINRTLDVVRLKDNVVPTIFSFTSSAVRPPEELSTNVEDSASDDSPQPPEELSIKSEDTSDIDDLPQFTSSSVEYPEELLIKDEENSDIDDLPQHSPSRNDYGNLSLREHVSEEHSSCSASTTFLTDTRHVPMDIQHLNPFYMNQVKLEDTCLLSRNEENRLMIVEDRTTKKMQKMAEQLLQQRKKIKALNQKCRRLKHRVHTYQKLVDELKSKNLVLHEGAVLLELFKRRHYI